jgi:Flp pilus assembly protein TadG
MIKTSSIRTRQHGAVAIIVGLTLAVLLGFAGLVIDLGRMYVNKAELQSAADACALAAANELICDSTVGTCPSEFLHNAEAAGIFVASRNNRNFQGNSVTIAANDVRFHTALGPNGSYQPRAAASASSKFAMCTARTTGLVPWFMGVLGIGNQSVSATAVATLAPGQTSCTAAPVGVCAKPGYSSTSTPPFGYGVGEWIISNFNGNGSGGPDGPDLAGQFRWVDFTPSAGGTNEVRDQLLGKSSVCGIRVGNNVKETGEKQGAKSAWNTRFGFYPNGANAETAETAPPDKTGYAYPSTAIPIGTSAYANYRSKQAAFSPFKASEYAPRGAAGNIAGNATADANYKTYGAERRLIAAPIIDCNTGAQVPIKAMACILMLNPMSNGNTGSLYLEWRGLANAANSPCRTSGVAGGTTGALVPTLVQ